MTGRVLRGTETASSLLLLYWKIILNGLQVILTSNLETLKPLHQVVMQETALF